MTQNPIDTLDQQLRDAVRRRRRHRRTTRRGALALVAALVVGGGVAAASQLIGSDDRSAADRAIAAGQRAALAEPVCATKRHDPTPQMVADLLPADITGKLGVFRRPRAPRDRVLTRNLHFGGKRVLTRSLRVARASDGARFAMFISYGEPNFVGAADEAGCVRAMLQHALAQPEAKNQRVRAEIEARLQGQIRRVDELIDGTVHYLTVDNIDPRGRVIAGGATILQNGKIPALASIGPGRHGGRRFVEISGLIPDGIATVRIIDSSGPPAHRVAPRVITIRDNVYHARVPRRTGPRITVQWRAPNGDVLRITHLNY